MHIVTSGQERIFKETEANKAYLKSLHQRSMSRWVGTILCDWMVIFFLLFAAVSLSNWILTFFCILFVGGRQHALLVLMHEAAHKNVHKNDKLAVRLSDFLCAWPNLISTIGYRLNHNSHHLHTNTLKDPDLQRKLGDPLWQFPKTKGQLILESLKYIFTVGAIQQYKMARHVGVLNQKSFGAILYLALFFSLMGSLLGLWAVAYYFLAYFLVLPVLFRWRSIGEHFGLKNSNYLNATRNIYCGVIERALIAPHAINLHLAHHLYPGVPFFNLKLLDEYLKEHVKLYKEEGSVSYGYMTGGERSVLNEVATVFSPKSLINQKESL